MLKNILISFLIIVIIVVGFWLLNKRDDQNLRDPNQIVRLLDSGNGPNNSNAAVSEAIKNIDPNNMTAVIKTNFGEIEIDLYESDAPNTVVNFANLAFAGFYNGTKFHRVVSGFMIQGGDPLSRDDLQKANWGKGGPGYTFPDEIHQNNQNLTATISMANSGPDTNGSQFFINVTDNNFLDQKHTVFGKVIKGFEVVQAIENTETGDNDMPLEPVVIESISIK